MGNNDYEGRPKFFKRIKNEIEAIRVTGDNAKDVARWCGGEAEKVIRFQGYVAPSNDSPVLRVPSLDEPVVVFGGDWLIKDESGRFSVMENAEFLKEFEFDKARSMTVIEGAETLNGTS